MIDSISKRFALVPVSESDESPLRKGYAVARDIRKLFKYFAIPVTFAQVDLPGGYQYPRQLLFQYNVTRDEDFYLLNVEQLRAFTDDLIIGGCVCIKYRIDEQAFRYKLFDHDTSVDWNYFPWYSNQLIKANFCIEFWGNEKLASEIFYQRGIIQEIILQTSVMYNPTEYEEEAEVADIESLLNILHLTAGFLPWNLPVNSINLVWQNNE